MFRSSSPLAPARTVARLAAGVALLAALLPAGAAHAQSVRDEFKQTDLSSLGDDGWTVSDFGFDANYYGLPLGSGVVCANGYLIMGGVAPGTDYCVYGSTVNGFDAGNYYRANNLANLRGVYGQVIAPYFSDMNPFTTGGAGRIWTGTGTVGGAAAWAATWEAVGGYPRATNGGSGTNTFQVVLIEGAGGTLNIEFNYGTLGFTSLADQRLGIGFADDGGVLGAPAGRYVFSGLPTNAVPAAGVRWTGSFDANGAFAGEQFATIPEPATVILTGAGLAALGLVARRRRRSA